MPVPTSIQIGTFCWPELCSADASASKSFYNALFGWQSHDHHMPEGDYTLFKLDGQNVGAMYQMAEDRKQAGVLPHWNSYVAVANADETADKAAALGGKVLMPPFDGTDIDRMANLQDPTGVNFCIWQAKGQPDPMRLGEVGSLCWTELYTSAPDKSAAFYSALFGWQPKPFDGEAAMPYTVFHLPGDERGVAGMPSLPEPLPVTPNWLPYFRVENADRTAELTRELGGAIANPPMDVPTVGRIAMLADPQGVAFAIIQVTR